MSAKQRWVGGNGFGRIRFKTDHRAERSARALVVLRYATGNSVSPDRFTVTGLFDSRSSADAAIAGDSASVVFETRSKLVAGERAYHCAGVAWSFADNGARKAVKP